MQRKRRGQRRVQPVDRDLARKAGGDVDWRNTIRIDCVCKENILWPCIPLMFFDLFQRIDTCADGTEGDTAVADTMRNHLSTWVERCPWRTDIVESLPHAELVVRWSANDDNVGLNKEDVSNAHLLQLAPDWIDIQ